MQVATSEPVAPGIHPVTICTHCGLTISPSALYKLPSAQDIRSNYAPPKEMLQRMEQDRLAFYKAYRQILAVLYDMHDDAGRGCELCGQCGYRLTPDALDDSNEPTVNLSQRLPAIFGLGSPNIAQTREKKRNRLYDEERKRLVGVSEELEAVRTEIVKCVKALVPFQVPIRRLPVEILEQIFLFYRDIELQQSLQNTSTSRPWRPDPFHTVATASSIIPTGYQNPSPLRVPLIICHTCSLWRQFAFDCPRLWDNLIIDFDRLPRGVVPLLHMHLKQSKDTLLAIVVTAASAMNRRLVESIPRRSEKNEKLMQTILPILFNASHRWQRASLTVPWESMSDARIVDLPPLPVMFQDLTYFPNLEELLLDWEGSWSRGNYLDMSSENILLKAYSNMPRLRALTLSSYHLTLNTPPPTQLTFLSLEHVPYTQDWKSLRTILEPCRNLEHLSLKERLSGGRPEPRHEIALSASAKPTILVLPRLSNLVLNFRDILRPGIQTWISGLFQDLIAPRLESLDISPQLHYPRARDNLTREQQYMRALYGMNWKEWSEEAFLKFLSRACPPGSGASSIRSLSLAGIAFTDTYLINVFELVPNLTRLSLCEVLGTFHPPGTPSFELWSFRLLNRFSPTSNKILLPKLTTLHVGVEESLHNFVVVQLGISMVNERFEAFEGSGASRLEEFAVNYPDFRELSNDVEEGPDRYHKLLSRLAGRDRVVRVNGTSI